MTKSENTKENFLYFLPSIQLKQVQFSKAILLRKKKKNVLQKNQETDTQSGYYKTHQKWSMKRGSLSLSVHMSGKASSSEAQQPKSYLTTCTDWRKPVFAALVPNLVRRDHQ